MTALYTQNFDSLSDGTPAGWTTIGGVGMYSGAASTWGLTAVSGTRVIGRNGNGDSAVYSTAGSLTDQALRTAHKWVSHSSPAALAHILRANGTSYNTGGGYRFDIQTNGSTSLRVQIYKIEVGGGHTSIGTSSYSVSCSVGDVVHFETKAVGTTLEARLWTNSAGRPSTATLSVTDSTTSAGYVGLRVPTSTWCVADDLVITDAAGGEDYFYPESSGTTITGNFSAATASGFAASIAAATVISCALGSADASGYQATVQVGSNTTITASLGTATASGFSASVAVSGTGTLVTEPLKNNTGTLLASQTGATAFVYNVSTGALVVAKTGQTTDGSGVMTITDALISPATQYRVVVVLSGGAEGMAKYTAS